MKAPFSEGMAEGRQVSVKLFGPISVAVDGTKLGPRDFGGVKPKQILEALVAARGRSVSKDRLADLLWGESLPRNVTGTLETYVSVLRRRIEPKKGRGAAILVTEPGAYRFDCELAAIDLDEFDELVDRAARSDGKSARRLLEQALMLIRGDVLEDEPYAEWADPLRNQYRQAITQALLDAAEMALREFDYHAALAHAQHAMNTDPLNERAYRTVMVASYALGHQREALEAFDKCERMLAEELGVEPLEKTRTLHDAIRSHADPVGLLPHRGPAPSMNAASGSEEAEEDLVGRTEELRQIVERVEASLSGRLSTTFIEGVTGSGKTRLLDEAQRRLPLVKVFRTSCNELEADIPFSTLAGLFDKNLADFFEGAAPPAAGADVFSQTQGPVLDKIIDDAAYHAPMVIIIDDLHWADAASISVLSYIQRRSSEFPVAILATVGVDGLTSSSGAARLKADLRVTAGPLAPDDLIGLGVEELYGRTGGHAGYISEYLRSPASSLHQVPEAVRNSILVRCSAEGPLRYKLLLHAAIVEGRFQPEQVAMLTSTDPEVAAEELEVLCAHALLTETETGFDFLAMDVRDVLVGTLSNARRMILLRKAAALAGVPVIGAASSTGAGLTEGAEMRLVR